MLILCSQLGYIWETQNNLIWKMEVTFTRLNIEVNFLRKLCGVNQQTLWNIIQLINKLGGDILPLESLSMHKTRVGFTSMVFTDPKRSQAVFHELSASTAIHGIHFMFQMFHSSSCSLSIILRQSNKKEWKNVRVNIELG